MWTMVFAKVTSLVLFALSFAPQTTFVEGIVGQPRQINPLKAGVNNADRDLSRLIFRGLFAYDTQGEIQTDLAQSYSLSADQKEYTVNLRRGVYWHDGVEFSADDVLYTASQHPQLRLLSVDKLDRYAVKFTLRDPYAPFLDLLTLGLLPAHLNGRTDDLGPIGTGDYRLVRIKKSNKIDDVILLRARKFEKNERHLFTRLIFRFYEKPSDLVLAAKLGEIDAFASEEPVGKLPNFNQLRLPLGSRYYALFINLNGREELKNKDLRHDIAYRVPKERIAEEVFQGMALPAYSPSEFTFATPSALNRYNYQEAPTLKYDLNLNLAVPKKETHLRTATLIQDSLEKIGLHLTVTAVEPGKITGEVIQKKDFDLLLLGQEVERDPDQYTLWHSTQKDLPGLNFTGFESVLADKALEEGRRNRDVAERIKHYQNFQKVFTEELPAVLLYHPVLTYSVRTDVGAVSLRGLFKGEDRFATLAEWSRL